MRQSLVIPLLAGALLLSPSAGGAQDAAAPPPPPPASLDTPPDMPPPPDVGPAQVAPPSAAVDPVPTPPVPPPPVVVAPMAPAVPPPPPAAAVPMPPPAPAAMVRPLDKDRSAALDGRLSRLKSQLKLTAQQEPLWPPVERVIRDTFAKRAEQRVKFIADRKAEREAKTPTDTIERLRERADFMDGRADDMRSLASAAEPLYDSLDPAQRRRFATLLRTDDPPAAGNGDQQKGNGRQARRAEQPSVFERLRRDVQRGWRELWE